jgi:hypothetical protein
MSSRSLQFSMNEGFFFLFVDLDAIMAGGRNAYTTFTAAVDMDYLPTLYAVAGADLRDIGSLLYLAGTASTPLWWGGCCAAGERAAGYYSEVSLVVFAKILHQNYQLRGSSKASTLRIRVSLRKLYYCIAPHTRYFAAGSSLRSDIPGRHHPVLYGRASTERKGEMEAGTLRSRATK